VLALRSTFTLARNNAQEIAGLPAGTPQPDSHYNIWLGQAQYARRVLENGAQLILIGNLQQTRDRLLPLDRMSIGGVYTVRGYRENQMIRDTGSIVNVEFDYPLVRNPGKGFNLSLVPFYDYGRGKNQSEAADTLTSMGLLTRMRWEGVSLDFSFAKRLSYPNFVRSNGGNLQDKGINFQLNYNFF
jgi:hemolysin activation/secretion protein